MTTLLQIGLGNALLAGLIAVLALAAGRWSRRPALAHSLWLLVLLKLVTPPLVLPRLAWLPPEPVAPASAPPLAPVDRLPDGALVVLADERVPPSRPAVAPEPMPSPWPGYATRAAAVVWLLGTVFVLGRAVVHVRRFQRLLGFGRPAPAEVQAEAAALAVRLGLRRCPAVVLLPGSVPPLVWAGWGRPSIYLPEVLLGRLDDEQRAALLAHELAHVGRRDHWVRRVELLAVALYWWYPLVWWARRQLQAHEEECCDAWVAAELSPRAYATAILETLDFLAETKTGVPVLASGLGRVHALKRRLTLILTGRTHRGLTASIRLALLAVAGLVLPLVPLLARTPPPTPEPSAAAVPAPPTPGLAFTGLQPGEEPVAADGPSRSEPTPEAMSVGFWIPAKEVRECADGRYFMVLGDDSEGRAWVPQAPGTSVTWSALTTDKKVVFEALPIVDDRTGKVVTVLVPQKGEPRSVIVRGVAQAAPLPKETLRLRAHVYPTPPTSPLPGDNPEALHRAWLARQEQRAREQTQAPVSPPAPTEAQPVPVPYQVPVTPPPRMTTPGS